MSGTLYVVATPIGNLEDMTYRAVRILQEVALIAAEDTRHSRKLLDHYAISTRLISYHDHNEKERSEQLVKRLRDGDSLALISDAGTPCIADPGYRLVSLCRREGVPVVAVPGPSALVAALSISGLPTDSFRFLGFLPARAHGRRQLLESLKDERQTLACYEAPHRLLACLNDVAAICGSERNLCIARELTKRHEELFSGTAGAALESFGTRKVRGEIVLLLAPAADEKKGEMDDSALALADTLRKLLVEGVPLRQAAKTVAKEFGVPKDEVYRVGVRLKSEDG